MLRLLERFGLAPGRPAPELVLPGSPERCLERLALLDAHGRPWMLERLHPSQAPRREALAELLTSLCAASPYLSGVVPAPRRAVDGGFVPRHDGWCWQLSPFVAGVPLPRPEYLDHTWRGEAVAEFLATLHADMHTAAQSLPALPPAPEPDLGAYADGLFAAIERHAPHLAPRLSRLRAHLRNLPELLAAQPVTLAHGDLHPLNVIWGEGRLNAVIDWEFAGARPLLYDAANCLGCAGFEHPSGLGRGFAAGLVEGLRARGFGEFLGLLPAMVPVTRLGWLSEWLRKGEAGLTALELDYLDLLLDALPGKGI